MSGKTGHTTEEKQMAHSDTTQNENRNWFRIAVLALLPTLAAGLIFILMSGGEANELATEDSTTTTATVETTTTTEVVEEPEPVQVELPQTPEEDEDETEDDEAEVLEEDEPEPQPAPAELGLPDEVGIDEDGYGTIEISNLGDETLEIDSVDHYDHPIQMGEGAVEMAGGTSQELAFHVDTSELPIGAWEMTITFHTNGGVGDVKVKGFKWFVVHIAPPDLEISSPYIVPHQVNAVSVKIVNNEDYNVTVGLSSEYDRLSFPDEVELEPGDNYVFVAIQAYLVNPAYVQMLSLSVNWGETELGTVTIQKHGS